jgi:succinyl-CoA synthetase alpha subunit
LSILADRRTRLLVQGITGREGLFHASQMLEYGTQVVAGVSPGKGGEWVLGEKVPVFDTVESALTATGANCSVLVPARFAADAMLEAAEVVPLLVCITGGIPSRT